MALDVLDEDVRGRAVDRHLDHLSRVRERVAQHPRVDREVLRVLAAAVDDARNLPVAAQAPRGTRALGRAQAELERGGLGGSHKAADDGSETGSGFDPAWVPSRA